MKARRSLVNHCSPLASANALAVEELAVDEALCEHEELIPASGVDGSHDSAFRRDVGQVVSPDLVHKSASLVARLQHTEHSQQPAGGRRRKVIERLDVSRGFRVESHEEPTVFDVLGADRLEGQSLATLWALVERLRRIERPVGVFVRLHESRISDIHHRANHIVSVLGEHGVDGLGRGHGSHRSHSVS